MERQGIMVKGSSQGCFSEGMCSKVGTGVIEKIAYRLDKSTMDKGSCVQKANELLFSWSRVDCKNVHESIQ